MQAHLKNSIIDHCSIKYDEFIKIYESKFKTIPLVDFKQKIFNEINNLGHAKSIDSKKEDTAFGVELSNLKTNSEVISALYLTYRPKQFKYILNNIG
jgi:hypothetical protein